MNAPATNPALELYLRAALKLVGNIRNITEEERAKINDPNSPLIEALTLLVREWENVHANPKRLQQLHETSVSIDNKVSVAFTEVLMAGAGNRLTADIITWLHNLSNDKRTTLAIYMIGNCIINDEPINAREWAKYLGTFAMRDALQQEYDRLNKKGYREEPNEWCKRLKEACIDMARMVIKRGIEDRQNNHPTGHKVG